jgi:hypothetical protein
MFKKMAIHLTEPICLCLEKNLQWNVGTTADGPSLIIWCGECGVKMAVPTSEFKGAFVLDVPYPGKPKSKNKVEVVIPAPGDVIDITEFIRRKREQEPPS